MKRIIAAVLLAVSLAMLTACGGTVSADADDARPSRMVTQLDITFNPADSELERCYIDQAQISSVLNQLRDLDTQDFPKEYPSVKEEKEYCTITATYADGSTRVYCLLEELYLNSGDEVWCIVDTAKAAALTQYIADNPAI